MQAPRALLRPFGFLGFGRVEEAAPVPEESSAHDRQAERHELTGAVMSILVDGIKYELHVKDFSSTGVSGLTDAPLALNQTVILYLTKQEDPVALQIRWIKRSLVGASFRENVSDKTMQRLLRGHKPRKG